MRNWKARRSWVDRERDLLWEVRFGLCNIRGFPSPPIGLCSANATERKLSLEKNWKGRGTLSMSSLLNSPSFISTHFLGMTCRQNFESSHSHWLIIRCVKRRIASYPFAEFSLWQRRLSQFHCSFTRRVPSSFSLFHLGSSLAAFAAFSPQLWALPLAFAPVGS